MCSHTGAIQSYHRTSPIPHIGWFVGAYKTLVYLYTRRRETHPRLELHLLEYHKRVFEYLECFESFPTGRLIPMQLKAFSKPTDKLGYNDNPICNDLITEVFLEFSDRTRNEESDEYLRTLTGTKTTPFRVPIGQRSHIRHRAVHLRRCYIQNRGKVHVGRLERKASEGDERWAHKLHKRGQRGSFLGKRHRLNKHKHT